MASATGTPETVGLIGTGLLGNALADRLIQAGFTVIGWDINRMAMDQLVAVGGTAADTLEELSTSCQRFVLSLPNADIVEQVLETLQPSLSSGSMIVDTTTGDPERTRQQAGALQTHDIRLIDATVLGSSVVARDGRAVLMVGADTATLQSCDDILQAISSQIHHVGPVGSGQEMKLVANLVLGLNRAVLAEGLYFADRLGLDLPAVLKVLQSGAAYSTVMDAKGRKMIEQDFSVQARLSQHLKDVRLILNRGRQTDADLPLSELHRTLLERVESQGGGGLDNSAVISAWTGKTGPAD